MSRIPATLGACAGDNDLLITTLNEAQGRLIKDEKQPDEGWWGTWARIAFNLTQSDPYFVTDRNIARVTAIDICKRPVRLWNEFQEYLEFGTGLHPVSCCTSPRCENLEAFDRGLAITFKPFTAGRYVRIFATDETDYGKRVLISAKDIYDNIINSQDGFNRVTGEFLTLASPFVDSVNAYNDIDGIQKDETNGAIQIQELDPSTGNMRLILTMQPKETVAAYRRYFVNGLPDTCCASGNIQVSALCKLDFIPAEVDSDYLIIQNLEALKEECQAIRYDEMDSPNAQRMAQVHHAKALQLLFGELDHFIGKERVSISVPLWNGNRLQRQPI